MCEDHLVYCRSCRGRGSSSRLAPPRIIVVSARSAEDHRRRLGSARLGSARSAADHRRRLAPPRIIAAGSLSRSRWPRPLPLA